MSDTGGELISCKIAALKSSIDQVDDMVIWTHTKI